MTIPAIVMGGTQILGGLLGGRMGQQGQQAANAMNIQLAREQMAFQERMRRTQYQTAVEDMAAAGLNPALAYQQGGAGTPTGTTGAPQQNAALPMANAVSSGVSTALSVIQQLQGIHATEKQIEAQGYDNVKKEIDAGLAATSLKVRDKDGNFVPVDPHKLAPYAGSQLAGWYQKIRENDISAQLLGTTIEKAKADVLAQTTGAREAAARSSILEQQYQREHLKGRVFEGANRAVDWLSGAFTKSLNSQDYRPSYDYKR